jgi:endonuclease-3
MKKLSFDIDVAMEHIREAARPFPKAAMFELRDDGFGSPFEQLIACMLSVRTRDEVSLVDARRLFNVAGNSETVAELTLEEIDALIPDVTFHGRKAAHIRDIAIRVRDDYDNILPCDAKIMQSFAGIGPKCANLALGIACGQRRLGSLDTGSARGGRDGPAIDLPAHRGLWPDRRYP